MSRGKGAGRGGPGAVGVGGAGYRAGVAHWREIEDAHPEFAARVRGRWEASTEHVPATLRRDGAPRLSGIELVVLDGDLQFGMMTGSRKLDDVRRDPRVAVHPAPRPAGGDGAFPGDAKASGRAVEFVGRVDPDHPDAAQLWIDVDGVVLTWVDSADELLVVESWHPRAGYRRRTRR